MKNYKIYISVIMLIFVSQFLVGCATQEEASIEKEVVTKLENNSKTLITNGQNKIAIKNLKIANNCIGCNYCIAVDSEHFARNYRSKIPTVISQKNLDTFKLKTAIKKCPTRSISL